MMSYTICYYKLLLALPLYPMNTYMNPYKHAHIHIAREVQFYTFRP